MRYWKEIAYCIAGILAVWRLSKMSMVDFMRNYQWSGGLYWFRVALIFRNADGGFLYRIRKFRLAHFIRAVSASRYVKEMMPSDLIQKIGCSSVWIGIIDTNRDDLSMEELNDFYSLGDKDSFMACLSSSELCLVNEVEKAFDNLPENIEVRQPIQLFRRD